MSGGSGTGGEIREAAPEPCGSWRVTQRYEGADQVEVWCDRRSGPCPYEGTTEARQSGRKCATSPGVRLNVTWHDDAVRAARSSLRGYNGGDLGEQTIQVAIDALTTCLGDDDT